MHCSEKHGLSTFKTLPSFEAAIDRTRLLAIVCFSLLVGFLLFAITLLLVARSKMLAAEIIRRDRDQEALRELKTAVEQSADGIAFAAPGRSNPIRK